MIFFNIDENRTFDIADIQNSGVDCVFDQRCSRQITVFKSQIFAVYRVAASAAALPSALSVARLVFSGGHSAF